MKTIKNTTVYIIYTCLIWWQCMVVAVAAEPWGYASVEDLIGLSLD